jgi:hypothetical protein
MEAHQLYNADAGISASANFVSIGGTPCMIADGVCADRLVRVLEMFSGLLDMFGWPEMCQSWLRQIREHFQMSPVEAAGIWPEVQFLNALVAGRHHDGRAVILPLLT